MGSKTTNRLARKMKQSVVSFVSSLFHFGSVLEYKTQQEEQRITSLIAEAERQAQRLGSLREKTAIAKRLVVSTNGTHI